MRTIVIYWNAIRIIALRLTLGVFEFAVILAFGAGWLLRTYERGIQPVNFWNVLKEEPLGILGDSLIVGGIAAIETFLFGLLAAVVVATLTALAFRRMENRDRYARVTRTLAIGLALVAVLAMLFVFRSLPDLPIPIAKPFTLFVLVLPVPLAAALEMYHLISRNFTAWYINTSYSI